MKSVVSGFLFYVAFVFSGDIVTKPEIIGTLFSSVVVFIFRVAAITKPVASGIMFSFSTIFVL